MWRVDPTNNAVVECPAADITNWTTLRDCVIASCEGKYYLAGQNRQKLINSVASAQYPHANNYVFAQYIAALNDPAEQKRLARGVMRIRGAGDGYTEYYVSQAKLLHANVFCAHATAMENAHTVLLDTHGFAVPKKSAVAAHINYHDKTSTTGGNPGELHIADTPHMSRRTHLPLHRLGDVAAIACLLCLNPVCVRACVVDRYDALAHMLEDAHADDTHLAEYNAPACAQLLRDAKGPSADLITQLASIFTHFEIPHVAESADTLLIRGDAHGQDDYLISTRANMGERPCINVGHMSENAYYDNVYHNLYDGHTQAIYTHPPKTTTHAAWIYKCL